MKSSLFIQALLKLLSGLTVIFILLFLPAGTLMYKNAWLLMALLFVPMTIVGIVLLKKSPDLLAKRLNMKENQNEQKWVILLSLIMFIGGFVVAGLDFRYGWSQMPSPLVIIFALIFLIAYGLFAEVMRENAYLSRTVEVQENQEVVDTGLYGIVRHPMYFASVLLFLSMPLVLGSYYAFLIFLMYPFLLIKRIKNEEALLSKELKGYDAYMKKVRYRILPFIW